MSRKSNLWFCLLLANTRLDKHDKANTGISASFQFKRAKKNK
jgi:hypothetical protein